MDLGRALVAVALIAAVVVFRVTEVIEGESLFGAILAALIIYVLVID